MCETLTTPTTITIAEFNIHEPIEPSEARIAANRANAKKSTGPRTKEGKERSRCNAITHQLKTLIIPADQNSEALEAERREWIDCFQPTDAVSLRMADIAFRCCRRLETVADAEDAAVAKRVDQSRLTLKTERWDAYCKALAEQETDPVASRFVLETSVMGCQKLIEQLELITARLDAGEWTPDDQNDLRITLGYGVSLIGLRLPGWTQTIVDFHQALALRERPNLGLSMPEDLITLEREVSQRSRLGMPTHQGMGDLERKRIAWSATLDAELERINVEIQRLAELAEQARAEILKAIERDRLALTKLVAEHRANENRAEQLARAEALFDTSEAARLRHRYLGEAQRALPKAVEAARLAAKVAREALAEQDELETPVEAPQPTSPNEPKPKEPAQPAGPVQPRQAEQCNCVDLDDVADSGDCQAPLTRVEPSQNLLERSA